MGTSFSRDALSCDIVSHKRHRDMGHSAYVARVKCDHIKRSRSQKQRTGCGEERGSCVLPRRGFVDVPFIRVLELDLLPVFCDLGAFPLICSFS